MEELEGETTGTIVWMQQKSARGGYYYDRDGIFMRPDDLKDFAQLLDELQAESDRGLALVGASVLDDRLGSTLRAFFVDGSVAPASGRGWSAQASPIPGRTAPARFDGLDLRVTFGLADHEVGVFDGRNRNTVLPGKGGQQAARETTGRDYFWRPRSGEIGILDRPQRGA